MLFFLPAFGFAQLNFSGSLLTGNAAVNPTCLAFGPDNRLYVSEKDGLIYAYTLDRLGDNDYVVTSTEVIGLINAMPNFNDDTGNRNLNVFQRQVTGLLAAGTAAQPMLYVCHSDPRQGAGTTGDDKNLDTNSGIISRLSWNGTQWEKVDLVRGLPRSEENHAINGIHFSPTGDSLFVTCAGFTNAGGPSNNFAYISETALSAAILSVDLGVIEALPVQTDAYGQAYLYDIPTTDDPTRPNLNGITNPNVPGYDGIDINDPFGGNDGLNQGKIVPGGPVQVYAPGFRNPYDIEITQAGHMYSLDNGANPGWGGYPENEGTASVTNNYLPGEPGFVNNANGLHRVPGPGYYAGHPNPIRANPAGAGLYTHDGTGVWRTQPNGPNPLPADWPPLPLAMANPIEGDFQLPGVDNASLIVYAPSSNGLAEYTASNLNGVLQGNLLCAGYNGDIFRAVFNAQGDAVVNGVQTIASGIATQALDIVCRGDGESFPGTIWITDFAEDEIIILEPADYGGKAVPPCTADNNPTIDEDGDGYHNADEIANGTDPCSASSQPPDWDGDLISDLLDNDDDNDGLLDVNDAFALDADNGLTTAPRLFYDLFNEDPAVGFFGVGFTGLMVNGSTDYLDQYDQDEVVAGGTAGLVTIPTTDGDAALGPNNQDNAFQLGVHLDSDSCLTRVHTRLLAPFFGGVAPSGSQSMGLFVGTGDQDNYIKIVIDGNLTVITEDAGTPSFANYLEPRITDPSTQFVDLYLTVDPANGTVQPAYSVNNGGILNAGPLLSMGPTLLAAVQTTATAMAVGIISTHNGSSTFSPTWDLLEVDVAPSPAQASLTVAPGTANGMDASSHQPGSFVIENTSPDGQRLELLQLDLRTALLPDLLFDPNGQAGDDFAKTLTPDGGSLATGYDSFSFQHARDNGFETLTMYFTDFDPGETFSFSLDIDPSSIQGSTAPGPQQAGYISGIELSGATVRVRYDDCAEQSGRLFPVAGSEVAARASIQEQQALAPSLEILGIPTATFEVAEASQTVRIEGGPPQGQVHLLQLEAGLYVGGNGFDLDDFEANALESVTVYSQTLNNAGSAEFPITLESTTLEAGLNHLVAVIEDANGNGLFSNQYVLALTSSACDLLLVNVGGSDYTAADGALFLADYGFSGGSAEPFGGPQGQSISGTNDDVLYQTYRSKVYGGASYAYALPVANGTYRLKLHFAELFFTADDARAFDVSVEGVQVLNDYDIHQSVGFEAADVQEFSVEVSDGQLDLSFTSIGGFDSPTLAAIELEEACGTTTFSVELIDFQAMPREGAVDLQWSTATESQNAFFTPQRSKDGHIFESLAQLPGAGNSQRLRQYAYTDPQPFPHTSYYRLKQTDWDGGYSYSEVVQVQLPEVAPTFRLINSPSADPGLIQGQLLGFAPGERVALRLFDATGRELSRWQLETDVAGSLRFQRRLPPTLVRGLYYVQLSKQDLQLSRRLWIPSSE